MGMEWCIGPCGNGGIGPAKNIRRILQAENGFFRLPKRAKGHEVSGIGSPIKEQVRSFDKINFPNASKHEAVKIKDLTPFSSHKSALNLRLQRPNTLVKQGRKMTLPLNLSFWINCII
jgi:hypothetical protein